VGSGQIAQERPIDPSEDEGQQATLEIAILGDLDLARSKLIGYCWLTDDRKRGI
jgi:hypothetical protein